MIKILRSQVATLVVLSLALLAQLPHAAEVFMTAGASHGALAWLHGLAYAVALELAVLLFVVQERRHESYGFAGVSVLVNLAYYAERVSLFSIGALPAWLISLALPLAIALYSHAIANDKSDDTMSLSRLTVTNDTIVDMTADIEADIIADTIADMSIDMSRGTVTDKACDMADDMTGKIFPDMQIFDDMSQKRMSPEERQRDMLSVLPSFDTPDDINLDILSDRYGVTSRTIRRDIDKLVSDNRLHLNGAVKVMS